MDTVDTTRSQTPKDKDHDYTLERSWSTVEQIRNICKTNVPADDAHGDVEDNVESQKSRRVETHDKDHQSS